MTIILEFLCMKEHTIQRIRAALSELPATGRRERAELDDLNLIVLSDYHRGRGNRVQGRTRFVHEDDFRADRNGAGNAEALLLSY